MDQNNAIHETNQLSNQTNTIKSFVFILILYILVDASTKRFRSIRPIVNGSRIPIAHKS